MDGLPSFRYWLRRDSLTAALAFIVTTMLALIGDVTAMPPTAFRDFTWAAALVTALAWWNAAKSAERAEIAEAKAAEDREILRMLRDDAISRTQSGLEDITQVSNRDIKKRVQKLTVRMREFEGRLTAERSAVGEANWRRNLQNLNEEQRHVAFHQESEQRTHMHTQAQNEFATSYRPEAYALQEEMRRRLGMFPPYRRDDRTIAIEYGMLAGVNPITEAALFLESLARKLPD